MNDWLSKIRGAMRYGDHAASANAEAFDEPTATAEDSEVIDMVDQPKTFTAEEHAAAVTKAAADARAEGLAAGKAEGIGEGAKATETRFATILGDDGIKGDAARMGAAFDLAVKSPSMGAAEIVSFVSGNLPAANSPGSTYEQERLSAAAGLTSPAGGKSPQQASAVKAGWAKAFKTG